MEMDYEYQRHLVDERESYSISSSDSIDDECWDSDDDDDLLNFLYIGSNSRSDKYQHSRLCWEEHLAKLQHEGM